MDGNYIKISRSILDWEWYSDINTCRLFIHMLLKANWKNGKFKGLDVPRGSFVSTLANLSEETRLTQREVRTAISRLKTTGEVTSKTTSKIIKAKTNKTISKTSKTTINTSKSADRSLLCGGYIESAGYFFIKKEHL